MERSLRFVLLGTFTLRFSTGLTGAMLGLYLADLPSHGGPEVDARVVGLYAAIFYLTELVLSPIFGVLSDRVGHHKVMLYGPVFGGIAVVLTGLTTSLPILGATRLLEGASTAASVPSILGFIALGHGRATRSCAARRRLASRARRWPASASGSSSPRSCSRRSARPPSSSTRSSTASRS
jgi:MFS family permease